MPHLDASPGAAAQRAADLLVVLDPRRPGDAHEVEAVLRRHGEPEPLRLSRHDVAGLRRAARRLWPVFAAGTVDEAAARLNEVLAAYAVAPRLSDHQATPWHLHVDRRDDSPWEEWLASSSALALATRLAERQALPGGLCASAPCGRPFVDSGRGGVRRYCSSRCATRERVAAHRRAAG